MLVQGAQNVAFNDGTLLSVTEIKTFYEPHLLISVFLFCYETLQICFTVDSRQGLIADRPPLTSNKSSNLLDFIVKVREVSTIHGLFSLYPRNLLNCRSPRALYHRRLQQAITLPVMIFSFL